MPAPERRRFRPPWKVDEHSESFIVTDADDQPLTYSTRLHARRKADFSFSGQYCGRQGQ
jgi:hypothetical protein